MKKESMTRDALTLAKYIVTKCVNDDCPISNLQLQIILYFIQVDCFKRTDDPAFFDDFEAWVFGPVIPDVYYYFCTWGGLTILSTYDIDHSIACDDDINEIIEDKRVMKPWDLVHEVRQDKTWRKIWNDGKGARMIIPFLLIRKNSKRITFCALFS